MMALPGLGSRRGRAPGFAGAFQGAGCNVDEDLFAGEVGSRLLELGGVVEQAGACVFADVRGVWEDVRAKKPERAAQALLLRGPSGERAAGAYRLVVDAL